MDGDSIRLLIGIILTVAAVLWITVTEKLLKNGWSSKSEQEEKKAQKKLFEKPEDRLASLSFIKMLLLIVLGSLQTLFLERFAEGFLLWFYLIISATVYWLAAEGLLKMVATTNSNKWFSRSRWLVNLLVMICKPINRLKEKSLQIMNLSSSDIDQDNEILSLLDSIRVESDLSDQEYQLIQSAIHFKDLEANDILTPRVDVIAAELQADHDEIEDLFYEHGYSRILIYDDTIDHVVGVLHQKDFIQFMKKAYLYNKNISLTSILKPTVVAPPNMKIAVLLKMLQEKKTHMAVITDEYGITSGIVTLEDIVEELVGEIWDEHDEIEEEMIALDNQTYRVLAHANIDKVLRLFDIEDEFTSNTVSGFVIEAMGKMPAEGDSFFYHQLKITVLKLGFHRIHEVLIECIEEEQEQEDDLLIDDFVRSFEIEANEKEILF